MGKSQHQELETTGHMASRKQRAVDTGSQLLFSFSCSADPKPGDGSTHSGPVLLSPLTLSSRCVISSAVNPGTVLFWVEIRKMGPEALGKNASLLASSPAKTGAS